MLRIILISVMSLVLTVVIYLRFDQQVGSDGIQSLNHAPTYAPYYSPLLLPLLFLLSPIVFTPFLGLTGAWEETLSLCAGLFLHVSLFYLVLLALRPVLGKRMTARTGALLWVIPNLLFFTLQKLCQPSYPRLVLCIPDPWPQLFVGIWLAGMVGVLAVHIVQHLRFRRRILDPAVPATDPLTRYIWEEALKEAGFRNPKYQLVISPEVKTPLSIGLLPRCTRVVLPTRSYTREELYWVIRHEVIHLARQDSWNKFFLLFCTAICWFNPVMWVAMRACAQDLELSCDETVLLFAHQSQRKEYAALLLNTAGDARGFTTCLSASAATLRRRLERVLAPAARSSGAIVAGVLFFLLAISYGWMTVSYGTAPAAQVLYSDQDTAQYHIKGIEVARLTDGAQDLDYVPTDPQAFHDYLSGLSLSRLAGNYNFPDQDFSCFLFGPDNGKLIVISHQVMEVTELGPGAASTYYYLPQGVDWDYLTSLLEVSPDSLA